MHGSDPPTPGGAPTRVRVTLRFIEILDSKDLDLVGEFRFRFRAGVPERDEVTESLLPADPAGFLSISEHPAFNRVVLSMILFEGPVAPGESLLVEATGEEIDRLTRNDALTPYRRVFVAPLDGAFGDQGPWDEARGGATDPEQLTDWRIGYTIEPVPEPSPV